MTFDNDNLSVYKNLLEILESGKSGVLVTVIEKEGFGPAPPGAKMLVWEGTRVAGTVGGGAIEYKAIERAQKVEKYGTSETVKYSFNESGDISDSEKLDMICGGNATLFFEYIPPKERIYIFGAGHIGEAVLYHMKKLGFMTTVVDPREGFAENLQNAQKHVHGNFNDLLEQEKKIPKNSYFVIAGHSHELDYETLLDIFKNVENPNYIGCIASKSKAKEFVKRLNNDLKEPNLSRLYSPIGLATGGKTPADIAISIVAEIQAIRHGKKSNRHMSIIQDQEYKNYD
jgi:xanthine dehydrogenase accessory factor